MDIFLTLNNCFSEIIIIIIGWLHLICVIFCLKCNPLSLFVSFFIFISKVRRDPINFSSFIFRTSLTSSMAVTSYANLLGRDLRAFWISFSSLNFSPNAKASFAMSHILALSSLMESLIMRFSNRVVSIWSLESFTEYVPSYAVSRIFYAYFVNSQVKISLIWFASMTLNMTFKAFELLFASLFSFVGHSISYFVTDSLLSLFFMGWSPTGQCSPPSFLNHWLDKGLHTSLPIRIVLSRQARGGRWTKPHSFMKSISAERIYKSLDLT